MKWTTENATIPGTVTLYNAPKDSNLLSSAATGTKSTINGTLDLALAEKGYGRSRYPSGAVVMGIEVKENVEPRNDMQAVVELVLADTPSEYPLLSDFKSI